MATPLMVAATTPGSAEDPGVCLGVRFCDVNSVAHMEDLLIKQIRRRYSVYRDMKPKAIRAELQFDVYEITNPPRRGGYPYWLGPAGFYH